MAARTYGAIGVHSHTLVVELDVVEVDGAADLFVDVDVGTRLVDVKRGEPRRHGRVRDDVRRRQQSPQLNLEGCKGQREHDAG